MIKPVILDVLIQSLQEYKDRGVTDPWVLSDGSTVEPLDVLIEYRNLRESKEDQLAKGYNQGVADVYHSVRPVVPAVHDDVKEYIVSLIRKIEKRAPERIKELSE